MIKHFEKFLKEHDAYDDYIAKATNFLGDDDVLEYMIDGENPKDWISMAFPWRDDRPKWIDLHIEWQQEVRKLKTKDNE